MAEDQPLHDLLARLRGGDEEAAAYLFRRFARRLTALARDRLGGALRQKEDPEDVLQSVFKSFFLRHAEGQFDLDSWDGLWGLLARMTLHKCGHRVEHFLAARRDVRREVAAAAGPDESSPALEAIARDPTPSEAAVLAELVEQLHRELGARDRHILMLSLQGHGALEVAEQVGCTQRTVYRVLGWIRERLRQGVAEEPAPG